MLLSDKAYRKLQGLPVSMSSPEVSKLLIDMMSKSLGDSMASLVVVALGTVEMQDLRLQVSTKVQEVMT